MAIICINITAGFTIGDMISAIWGVWLPPLPSTLNVTVVVTVKLLLTCPSTGVTSEGLCGVVGLVHRGGGAGGIRSGPRFNVLGGVGLTDRPSRRSAFTIFPAFVLIAGPLLLLLMPLLLLLLPFMKAEIFSTSIDLRFWTLNVLVLPMMPVRVLSTGDIVNTTLSIDSGLSICCPVLVKLLRLDAVSDGVPAKLCTPTTDAVVGLKTAPTIVWFVVTTFCCCVCELKTVVPMPLDSVLDEAGVGLVFAVVGVVFADALGLAIG